MKHVDGKRTWQSHPVDQAGARFGFVVAGGQRKREAEGITGVDRVDQSVIPEPTCGVIRIALCFVLASDVGSDLGEFFLGCLCALHAADPDVDEHGFGGVGRHRGNP